MGKGERRAESDMRETSRTCTMSHPLKNEPHGECPNPLCHTQEEVLSIGIAKSGDIEPWRLLNYQQIFKDLNFFP